MNKSVEFIFFYTSMPSFFQKLRVHAITESLIHSRFVWNSSSDSGYKVSILASFLCLSNNELRYDIEPFFTLPYSRSVMVHWQTRTVTNVLVSSRNRGTLGTETRLFSGTWEPISGFPEACPSNCGRFTIVFFEGFRFQISGNWETSEKLFTED